MRALAALLLLLAVPACATTAEPGLLTRTEVRSLPDEALARRLFGPLAADMFIGLRDHGPLVRGGPEIVWVWTRPRQDWLRRGLCVSDRIIVHLEPAFPGVSRDTQPLRLHGMLLDTYFIVQNHDLATRRTGIDPRELEGLAEACAAIDPRRVDSTPADDGWQLMKAFELTAALGEAARAGRAPAPIDCAALRFNGPPPADFAECLSELAQLRETSVAGVSECAEAIALGGPCIRVQTSDWFIYFLLSQSQAVERIIVRGMEDTSQYAH